MTWQPWLLAACSVSVAVLGWVTYRRGKKNDEAAQQGKEALNVAENIKTTFDAQAEINKALREDVIRLRAAHQQCEEATNALRRALADAHLVGDEQSREVAHLKAVVDEHEETISRHELTINQLRAGTQADRREP